MPHNCGWPMMHLVLVLLYLTWSDILGRARLTNYQCPLKRCQWIGKGQPSLYKQLWQFSFTVCTHVFTHLPNLSILLLHQSLLVDECQIRVEAVSVRRLQFWLFWSSLCLLHAVTRWSSQMPRRLWRSWVTNGNACRRSDWKIRRKVSGRRWRSAWISFWNSTRNFKSVDKTWKPFTWCTAIAWRDRRIKKKWNCFCRT